MVSTHLRGRVRLGGRLSNGKRWFHIEIVNTSTGRVIYSDDTGSLSACCDYAHKYVNVARTAWTMDLRTKDLQESR